MNLFENLQMMNESDVLCERDDLSVSEYNKLKIDLEKDIRLPIRIIHSALPDCIRRYNIREIWGLCGSAWSDNAVKEIHPMRKAA